MSVATRGIDLAKFVRFTSEGDQELGPRSEAGAAALVVRPDVRRVVLGETADRALDGRRHRGRIGRT